MSGSGGAEGGDLSLEDAARSNPQSVVGVDAELQGERLSQYLLFVSRVVKDTLGPAGLSFLGGVSNIEQ